MPKESVAESRLDEVPTEVPLALVGASDAATAARLAMSQAAAGRGPVLLTGEIGCRPAEVAHALHAAAAPGSPFITIDCAAAVAADIEHRLFGSGPRRAPQELEMVGAGAAVVAAESGTLYLEHIDELPASAQRRLARILRDGEVRIDGSRAASRASFRLIGATSKDLEAEAIEGRFRAELLRRFVARVHAAEPAPAATRYFRSSSSASRGMPAAPE